MWDRLGHVLSPSRTSKADGVCASVQKKVEKNASKAKPSTTKDKKKDKAAAKVSSGVFVIEPPLIRV